MKLLRNCMTFSLFLTVSCALGSTGVDAQKRVLIFMNAWNQNDTVLADKIAWFAKQVGTFVPTVSPTTHRLGENGTLEELPFAKGAKSTPSTLYQELRKNGVRVLPILYNDETCCTTLLPKLRRLFSNPDGFIQEAVKLCVDNDLDGWNLDFEGFNGATVQDGVELVAFLDKLGASLHAHGKVLSMDYAAGAYYNSIWNETLLERSTGLDRLSNMGSYTDSLPTFVSSTQKMIDTFSLEKVGVGLCPACLAAPFTASDLEARFDLIEKLGVQELDIWVNNVPDGSGSAVSWLPYISKFVNGQAPSSPKTLYV